MAESLNELAAVYKARLQQGDLQLAYERLMRYVMALRSDFSNRTEYQVGNVSPGYMDFTYFPFFDEFLRNNKLRFGVVLNHSQMRFELWLMGQNAEVQKKYWSLLKNTEWNRGLTGKPRYSVLEAIIVNEPGFDDLEALSRMIEQNTIRLVDQIMPYVK